MKNGVIPLNMVFNGTSDNIDLMTKTLSPMGGVIRLISTTMTMTIPNQIRSKPNPSTKGTKIGTVVMERAKGIEPSSKAWEAFVLPLNYARIIFCFH